MQYSLIHLLTAVFFIVGFGVYAFKTKKALQARIEHYRQLVDNSSDIIFTLSAQGDFTYVSPNWQKLLGHEPNEVVGQSFSVFVPEESLGPCQDFLNKVMQVGHGSETLEYQVWHKDGSLRWHASTGSVIQKDGKISFLGIARDITEHKKVEAELQDSRSFLDSLLQSMPVPVFYKDLQGRYLGVNHAFEAFFGQKSQALIGKSVFDINPPELARIYHEKDRELFEQPGRQVYEARVQNVRGEMRSVIFHKASLTDRFGAVNGLVGAIMDITQRKQAETRLRESEEKYRLIFENAPLGVFHFDTQGLVIDCNDSFVKIIGSSREKLIGRNTLQLPDQEIVAAIRGALQGRLTTYEGLYKAVTAEKEIYLKIMLAPIRSEDDEIVRGTGIVEDITEHKGIEESLFIEKERLKTTLLSIGDGVIATDKRGRILLVNKIAEQLTGWTQEEAMGKSLEEIFHIINEFTRERCENPVSKVLETGNIIELANHTVLISKEGIERPIEDSAAPIRDENSKISGVVLVFRDFSEKKEKQDIIEYLSFHDHLTSLYNRRFFEEELKRLDTERNLPITLVMLDVNGLKLVNDAFGHLLGDQVLQSVAEVLRQECRADDIIARVGGDEFMLILPKTNSAQAKIIMQRFNDCFFNQKVESVNLSVSYGWETKQDKSQDMKTVIKKAEDGMYRRKLSESNSTRHKTIDVIMKTLNEKNAQEQQHLARVSQLCVAIGKALELNREDINELRTLGLMHDIGKIALDDKILNKTEPLTETEWVEIKRHSETGYRILSSVNEYAPLAEYVLAHHERWDGKGYPKGLKGEEIPLEARIIAVADAYDAMISDRPYRKALGQKAALEEIKKNSGLQFDPRVARAFIDRVIGQAARQDSGEIPGPTVKSG